MANLPIIQSQNKDLMLVEQRWKSQLDPVLASPLANGRLLENQVLVSGANTLNHGLGRKLQGYFVVLNSASATFFDSQSTNSMTQLTLVLNASASTTVSLWVF
jgi:hypothetical protein